MASETKIGELVTLLSNVAPEKLSALKSQFPDQSVHFKRGAVMGGVEAPQGCAVALEALTMYVPTATNLRLKIRRRLVWSWRFDLIAKFAAAGGSGGAVGALTTGVQADKAIIAAAVALAGTLCGLFFSYLQRDEATGSVTDSYNKLIDALVVGGEVQRSLPGLCKAGDSPELKEALTKANDTARTLNELILRYG
jgi:hypothetical protein